MIFLQYVHLSNHQALYLKHTQFYTYIKKGTMPLMTFLSILLTLVTFTVFTFLRKTKNVFVRVHFW